MWVRLAVLLGVLAVLTIAAFAVSLPLPLAANHDDMNMSGDMEQSHESADYYQDRLYSEFNHKLVGIFLILIGFMIIVAQLAPERAGWLRLLWPLCFIAPGIYVFIKGDPDGWPVGASLAGSFDHVEWAQHKIFALVLIFIGLVEFPHAENHFFRRLGLLSFTALTLAGIGLVTLHKHREGMEMGMHAMMYPSSMARIHAQHVGFALVGLVMLTARWFSGTGRWKWHGAPFVWPSLLILLALQLILYRE